MNIVNHPILALPSTKRTVETLPDTDLAYMAGLVDGEGSVSIFYYTSPCKGKYRYVRHRALLYVTNTDLTVMEWLVSRFGGKVVYMRTTKFGHKRCYHWRAVSGYAARIAKMILPFSVMKKEKLELLVRFINLGTFSKTHVVPPGVAMERAQIADRLSILNKRGDENAHSPCSSTRKVLDSILCPT